MAPFIGALERSPDFDVVPVVTGQHRAMLDQVNQVFGITPRFDLDIFEHGMSLSTVTERTLTRLTPLIRQVRPDAIAVQGDTTSVLAAALAAFYEKVPVVHLEAGLRTDSIASPFPEEGNRRLVTQVTSLHLAPTRTSRGNLLRSGVEESAIVVTGNTVIDALLATTARDDLPIVDPAFAAAHDDPRRMVLVTSHRRESWGEPMRRTAEALRVLAQRYTDTLFLFPLHANPAVREIFTPALASLDNVVLTESLGYTDLCKALNRCVLTITDSGGIQEEAPALGKPVVVLRDDTERPEAVESGTAVLVGTRKERIIETVDRLLTDRRAYDAMAQARNPFGDGRAADRSVDALRRFFGISSSLAEFDYEGAPA